MNCYWSVLFFVVMLAGCIGTTSERPGAARADRIEASVRDLSSNAFEGRLTGSEGYLRSAEYVIGQLREMGAVEATSASGYAQTVPMQHFARDWSKASLSFSRDGRMTALRPLEEFFVGTSPSAADCYVDAPAVFVGYGVSAPDFGIDPFKDIDVRGKIAVFLSGAPETLPPELRAHLEAQKLAALTRAGAVGYVRVYSQAGLERFPWERLQSVRDFKGVAWVDERGQAQSSFGNMPCSVTLSPAAGEVVFRDSPQTYANILEATSNADENISPFDLGTTIRITAGNTFERLSSPNVIGLLPGNDPTLASETIVMLAHLDHLGMMDDESSEDRIFNGAMDNAAGVGILLEVARLLSERQKEAKLKRTVMLAFVTGEEQGLVGSDYLATHFPADLLPVAVINLDMPMLLHEFEDIVALGADYSTLGEAAEAAAERLGVSLSPDPTPEQSVFVRSDHYRFVLQGIPALFLLTGPANGGGESREAFMSEHYHRVSDDISLNIRYDQAARLADFVVTLVEAIDEKGTPPSWKSDEFSLNKTHPSNRAMTPE